MTRPGSRDAGSPAFIISAATCKQRNSTGNYSRYSSCYTALSCVVLIDFTFIQLECFTSPWKHPDLPLLSELIHAKRFICQCFDNNYCTVIIDTSSTSMGCNALPSIAQERSRFTHSILQTLQPENMVLIDLFQLRSTKVTKIGFYAVKNKC